MVDQSKKIVTEKDIAERMSRIANKMSAVPPQQNTGNQGEDIHLTMLRALQEGLRTNRMNSAVILDANPEMRRGIAILSGFITNPDGGDRTTLGFDAKVPDIDGFVPITDDEVNAALGKISSHFTDVEKMPKMVTEMVRKILETDGAHVELYIPDASVDNLLTQVGNQSYSKGWKPADKAAAMSTLFDNGDDTLEYMKVSSGEDLRKLFVTREVVAIGNEAVRADKETGGVNLARISAMRRYLPQLASFSIEASDVAKSRAPTLVKNPPPEATIRICDPGDREIALQYIFLIDPLTGNFISNGMDIDFDRDLKQMGDEGETNLSRISSSFGLKEDYKTQKNLRDKMSTLYNSFSKKFVDQVVSKLGLETYQEQFTLNDDNFVVDVLFHRALCNRRTQMITVPASMVSYISLFQDAGGQGQSLVARNKTLSMLRTVLFYATFVGSLDSVTPKTKLNVTYDSADTNTKETREMVIQEWMQNRAAFSSFSNPSPIGIMRSVSASGVQMAFNNGDQTDGTTMEISEEQIKKQAVTIDTEFLDKLEAMNLVNAGVSKQWVSDSYTPTFKAELVQENELVRRQIIGYVEILEAGLTDRVIKRIVNDPVLMNQVLSAFDDKAKGEKDGEGRADIRVRKLERLLSCLHVSFPRPEVLGKEINKAQLQDVLDVIDMIMDLRFPDVVGSNLEDFDSKYIDGLRASVKSDIALKFVREKTIFRSMLTDINDLLSDDGQGKFVERADGDMGNILKVASALAKQYIRADRRAKGVTDKAQGAGDAPAPTGAPTDTGGAPAPAPGGDVTPEGGAPGDGGLDLPPLP